MNKTKGRIFLLIATVIWGLAFVVQDEAAKYIGAFTVNTFRNIVGILFLLPIVLIRSKKDKIPVFEKTKQERKCLLIAGLCCGSCLFVAANLQQLGITLYPESAATSGRSGFITALYIIWVPLLSLFLNKKININVIISVIVCLVGLYLLCFTKGINNIYLGDLIVLGSAISFAVHILCVDKFAKAVDPIKLSMFQFATNACLSAITMLIVEKPSVNDISNAIWPILYLGIGSSGIAFTFQIIGQKNSDNPTIDSIVMSLESVVAVIGGALILKEKFTNNELIGCILMFSAFIFSQLPPVFSFYLYKLKKLLGKEVNVIIDRPIGSKHPNYEETIYEINYGYIKNLYAPDKKYQDAYVVGIKEPLEEYKGVVKAVVKRKDDIEHKIIVVPTGVNITKEEIEKAIHFIEKYYKHELII